MKRKTQPTKNISLPGDNLAFKDYAKEITNHSHSSNVSTRTDLINSLAIKPFRSHITRQWETNDGKSFPFSPDSIASHINFPHSSE